MYNLSLPGHDLDKGIDSAWNGVFAVFLAVWSTVFVESWKKKQNRLIYEWDMDSL